MNIEPNEKQSVWCEDIKKFALEELTFDLERRDDESEFSEKNWQACAAKGVLGLNLPKAYGGSGHDLPTSVHIMEALGYACPDNGLTLALNGQMWAVQEPLARFGTVEQKAEFLPKLIDGRAKGALAMTEKDAGSDAFSLKTTAKKSKNGYVLNGVKTHIGLAPVADLILVFASTKPERKKWGISAFIINANLPGITLHSEQNKMGLRTAPLGEITFDNVEVPDQSLLGNEGAGASIFSASMDFERSFIFASHVGSMRRQLDEVVTFAKQRRVGGTPIGNHQSVSSRIADMRVRVQTARFFLHESAALLGEGKSIPMEAAMAKLAISEAFVENSLAAIRTHGGTGYLTGTGVERDLRDAVGGVIYSGTSDIQRNLIARLLGL